MCRHWLLITLVLAGAPAAAGTITWNQTLTTDVTETRLQCRYVLTQQGTEPAKSVTTTWEFAGAKLDLPIAADAPPQNIYLSLFDTLPAPAQPGWYPLILRLSYADLNHYPFSSVLVHLQRVGEAPPAPLLVRPATLKLSGDGSVTMHLAHRGSRPLALAATVVAPAEIRVEEPQAGTPIRLDPGEEAEIEVSLSAGDALPGYRGGAYLILEGEDEGRHVAAIGAIGIEVVEPPAPSATRRLVWRLAALAVLAVCILALAWPIYRRRTAPPAR